MHTKRNISLSILFTFFLFAVTGVFLLVQCSDMVADMTGNKDDKGFNEEYPGLCDMDEECPEGFICVDGRCIAYENPIPCFANADCPADYACLDGYSVSNGSKRTNGILLFARSCDNLKHVFLP